MGDKKLLVYQVADPRRKRRVCMVKCLYYARKILTVPQLVCAREYYSRPPHMNIITKVINCTSSCYTQHIHSLTLPLPHYYNDYYILLMSAIVATNAALPCKYNLDLYHALLNHYTKSSKPVTS